MSETLSGAVGMLRQAGETLAEAGARMMTNDPGPRAFGVDSPGALGELGRGLHAQWQRALDARTSEATAHAVRLGAAGDLAAEGAAGYADIDHSARRAQPEAW